MYDGDMAGDDDDESDLRCLLLRTGSEVVTKVDDDDDVGMAVNVDDDNNDDDVVDDMSDAVAVVVMAFVMAAWSDVDANGVISLVIDVDRIVVAAAADAAVCGTFDWCILWCDCVELSGTLWSRLAAIVHPQNETK